MLRLLCEPLLVHDERFAAATARPVVIPEMIVIDYTTRRDTISPAAGSIVPPDESEF